MAISYSITIENKQRTQYVFTFSYIMALYDVIIDVISCQNYWQNAKSGYLIALKTTIYRFFKLYRPNKRFLWVFLRFGQVFCTL